VKTIIKILILFWALYPIQDSCCQNDRIKDSNITCTCCYPTGSPEPVITYCGLMCNLTKMLYISKLKIPEARYFPDIFQPPRIDEHLRAIQSDV
jgi:hypothetical protein